MTSTKNGVTGRELMNAEAMRRVTEALDHVQAAQDELDRAIRVVFHVAGAVGIDKRLGKERERVHELWYWLENLVVGAKSERLTLDAFAGPRFLDELMQSKGGAP